MCRGSLLGAHLLLVAVGGLSVSIGGSAGEEAVYGQIIAVEMIMALLCMIIEVFCFYNS